MPRQSITNTIEEQDLALLISDIESELARIWSEVLRLPVASIGLKDHFFALGGDSMLVPVIMEKVNAHFFGDREDAALPIAEFFTYGTIDALAARLAPRLGLRDADS